MAERTFTIKLTEDELCLAVEAIGRHRVTTVIGMADAHLEGQRNLAQAYSATYPKLKDLHKKLAEVLDAIHYSPNS